MPARFCTYEEQRRVGVRLSGNLGVGVGCIRLAVRHTAVVHMDRIVVQGTAVVSHIVEGIVVVSHMIAEGTAVVVDHVRLHILGAVRIPEAVHIPGLHTPGGHRTIVADKGRRTSLLALSMVQRFRRKYWNKGV